MSKLSYLLFIILVLLHSQVLALESADLFVIATKKSVFVSQNQSASSSANRSTIIVRGTIKSFNLQLNSLNQIALYDGQGQAVRLLVERGTLVYIKDRIQEMTIAFSLPQDYDLQKPLKLIWTQGTEILAMNQDVPFLNKSDPLAAELTFICLPTTKMNGKSRNTFMVEVAKRDYYRLWYLSPLIIILLVACLLQRAPVSNAESA